MKKITIKFWTGAAALGLLCQAAPFTVRAQEGKIWEETRETALDVETLFNDSTAPSADLSFNENEFISEPSPNAPQSSPEMTGQENPKEEEKGNLIITRGKMDKAVISNSDFEMEIFLESTWQSRQINNGKLWVELPAEFSMDPSHEKETIDIPAIGPGETKKVIVKLHAGNIEGNRKTIKIPVNVSYIPEGENGETIQQQENILIPAAAHNIDGDSMNPPVSPGDNKPEKPENENEKPEEVPLDPGGYNSAGDGMVTASVPEKKKTDPMTPRIIVNQYQYGENIEDGKEFTVTLTFCNTNDAVPVENIIANIEPGEEVSLKNMTNVVYLKKLGPQASHTLEVKLRTAGNGKTDKAEFTLGFKYEYLKNGERTEGEASQKIVIPVKEAERFSVGDIQTGDEISQGEEFSVSLPYVNKGKSPVYNVEAYLETEMQTGETYKYIGNVEAGTSGTLDFFVTPETAGEQKIRIKLVYENSIGTQKSVEKEGTFQAAELVEEMPEEWGEYTEEEPKSKRNPLLLIGAAGTGTGAAGLLFRRFQKRRKLLEETAEDEGFEV